MYRFQGTSKSNNLIIILLTVIKYFYDVVEMYYNITPM